MVNSACIEDIDCTDNAQQIFWQENGKMKNAYFSLGLEWLASVLVLSPHTSQEILALQ
jgi:hypothetical protein